MRRTWAVTVVTAVMAMVLGVLVAPAAQASTSTIDIPDPNSVTCSQSGLIDFENLPDQTDLSPTAINGVQFTTTGGFTWRVGDFATGNYNGKYPNGLYTSRGTHWAWLGADQGAGRLDFVGGPSSFFSALISSATPVVAEAYDQAGTLLETAGPTPDTTNTGHMTQLELRRSTADIAYVILHDSGNYFLVDAICTNAPGVGSVGRYVALGDSFSSGEGIPPFMPGSDTADNTCHRSASAYPYLITGRIGVPQSVEHWACSGSLIRDFYNANHRSPSEPPQRQRLGQDITLLTVGVSGNDVGFEPIASACVKTAAPFGQGHNDSYDPKCRENHSKVAATLIGRLKDGLPGTQCNGSACSLTKLLADLRADTPKARRFVIGYPNFLPKNPTGQCNGRIRKEDGSHVGPGADWSFSKEDTVWLRGLIASLNSKIDEIASRVGFTYVDVNDLFKGHEVCSDDPWLNGVVVTSSKKPSPFSFHPNKAGQRALADATSERISRGASDMYVRPGQTVTSQYAVDPSRASFTATTSWMGSDMGLQLTSPSGRVIDRSTADDADVTRVLEPTTESITVDNPEEGAWTIAITGLDVPSVGEAVRLDTSQRGFESGAPLATISATPDRGVGPVTVKLDGSYSGAQAGSIDSYSWTFDDGTPLASGPSVDHLFTEPGTHTVRLTVTDNSGLRSTAEHDVFVSAVNQKPVAQLFNESDGGRAPLAVWMSAGDSTDVDGQVVSYHWDFDGNGTTDLLTDTPETTHTYDRGGTFRPAVTVFDDLGGQSTATGTEIAVEGAAITVPDAPGGLSATAGDESALLTWSAPVSDGGAALTDYVIEYKQPDGFWTSFAHPPSAATSAIVTGLTNGTQYSFRVSAVNRAGTGAVSDTATATPEKPIPTPGVTQTPTPSPTATQAPSVPRKIKKLKAKTRNGKLILTWRAANGATSYKVKFGEKKAKTVTSPRFKISLKEVKSKRIHVWAVNGSGKGKAAFLKLQL